jgi:hypothetical protein
MHKGQSHHLLEMVAQEEREERVVAGARVPVLVDREVQEVQLELVVQPTLVVLLQTT